MHRISGAATATLLVLLLSAGGAAQDIEHRGLMKPTSRCITTAIGDVEYASGEIYMNCHADTVALKRFGFRAFEFLGRSVRCVRYQAMWPITVHPDSLPPGVSGINYVARPEQSIEAAPVISSGCDFHNPYAGDAGHWAPPSVIFVQPSNGMTASGMPDPLLLSVPIQAQPRPQSSCSGGRCR